MKRLSSLFFIVFLLLLSSSYTFSQGLQCKTLFLQKVTNEVQYVVQDEVKNYGQLKSDFPHNNKYSLEVPDQSDVLNQCGLGTCHLHSWVSMLEQKFKSTYHQDLKISTHYLSYQHWLHKSISLLNDKTNNIRLNLGESPLGSRMAIYNYGIIPDKAWTFNRKFQEPPISNRITEYIQNIIANAKWNMSKEVSDDKIKKIQLEAEKEIRNVFDNLIGKVPDQFVFNNQKYTPQKFLVKYYPELLKPVTLLGIDPSVNAKSTLIESNKNYKFISASLEVTLNTLKTVLDQGRNVYLSYSHNSQFIDAKTGIMSISAFEIPTGGAPLSRELRQYFEISNSGHAVQIVGYDFDPKTNKIIKLKIKNSWGEKSGDQGYYHMYLDYFNEYAKAINFTDHPAGPRILIEQVMPQQLNFDFDEN